MGELRRLGVDTTLIRRSGSRVGIYFLETGAAQRPSKVVYDRAGSSLASSKPGDFDWRAIFDGRRWFHISGITPAVSATAADLALEAVREARGHGVTVSCDYNYRANLWKYGKKAPEVMRELVKHVHVGIANEEDCQKSLGIASSADAHSGESGHRHVQAARGACARGVSQPRETGDHAPREQERRSQRLGRLPAQPERSSWSAAATTSPTSSIAWAAATRLRPASSTGCSRYRDDAESARVRGRSRMPQALRAG